jgi:hypothetical protein
MGLMNYILTGFIGDLNMIIYTESDGRKFFGGPEWKNFNEDTKHVKKENLAYFCFCLFSMVCSDQNMYSNFRFAYPKWVKRTQKLYPKFGWAGFGEHHEKPRFLLTVPEKHGTDMSIITENDIREFVEYNLKVSMEEFGIDTKMFFKTMIEDKDFTANVLVFEMLKDKILDRVI